MLTIFFVRKRNHGEECLPKHKGPPISSAFAKRRKLEVCILHLSYSNLVMIISTFTLLVWLVMVKY